MTGERYDAFISYNHAADARLAPVVESALQRLAKPWYKLRAISVYRDASDTGLTPSLWGTVQRRLTSTNWLILFACPESAASHWCEQESTHWCATKGTDNVLLVLTGGELLWDRDKGTYSDATTALSPAMRARFTTEPLYLDLRWAKEGVLPTLHDARFRGDIARLASPIRGRSPDELEGDDVRLQRKAKRLAKAAVATVAALAIVASIAAVVAVNSQREAERRAQEATARQLGLFALDMPASDLDQALLLSVVAADLDARAGADRYRASRTLLGLYSRLTSLLPVGEASTDVSVRGVAVSGDGSTVAATVQSAAGGSRMVEWSGNDGAQLRSVQLPAMATSLDIDGSGGVVIGGVGDVLTLVEDGELAAGSGERAIVAMSRDGRAIVAGSDSLVLVDLADAGNIGEWRSGGAPSLAAIGDDRAALVIGSEIRLVATDHGDVLATGVIAEFPAAIAVLGDEIVTVSKIGEVARWTATGGTLRDERAASSLDVESIGTPHSVAIAADGARIVVVGDHGAAIVDPGSASVLAAGNGAGQLLVDPSGRYAAVGGTSLTVWDVVTGQRVIAVPDKASTMAWSSCIEAATCRLVVGGEAIDAWNPDNGRRIRLADQSNAQSVAITDDASTVVSGGWGSTVAVWTLDVARNDDFFDGVQLTFEGAPAAKDAVTADFAQVVDAGNVRVTTADDSVMIRTGPLDRMRLVGDLHRLVTFDGSVVRVFDTRSATEVSLDVRCAGDLVATSPDGRLLVAHLARNGRTVACDTVTGALVAGGEFQGASLPADAVAIDNDGAIVLGGQGHVDYHARDGTRFAPGFAVDVRFGQEAVEIAALVVRQGRVAAGVRSATAAAQPARVLLWDADAGGAAVQFDTDHHDVAAVAIIGEANDIVVVAGRASDDGDGDVIVQTWEFDSRRRLGRGYGGLRGDVVYLAGDDFSVIGTDSDGRTFGWLLDRDPRREVCAIVGRGLTREEWDRAAGGALRDYEYDEVCPDTVP